MGKVVKLVMVTGANNNKFYTMTENSNNTFTVEYGRIGASSQTATYPMFQWQKKYNEKVKKGYVDNTDLFIVEDANTDQDTGTIGKVKDFNSNRSNSIINIVKKLQGWANKSVTENYTVTSEQVTQKQIDKAQEVLDQIVAFDLTVSAVDDFNKLLLNFYSIVPRKMKQVTEHLVSNTDSNLLERKNKIISEEQDTLDVMAGQVLLNSNTKLQQAADNDNKDDNQDTKDLISASGLELEEISQNEIDLIKSMMQNNSHKFKEAFKVKNTETQHRFDSFVTSSKTPKTELFWHGSRNENWWSIITSGLKIRPSNAAHTGSMFGDGVYFADKFQKSYGYTSGRNSYWAKGNSNEAVLALYDVHVGNQKHIKKHDSSCYSLNYSKIQKDGFDSVFAHGGIDLINNEYITYHTDQSTIKYLVIVEA
jgi:poly [ADP-ribose] polymerase 2/3/4